VGVFDHVTIRVSDRAASIRFYDTVLPVLGMSRSGGDDLPEWEDFSIATDGQPPAERLHIGFYASSRALVDAFHQAGVDAGYTSDGAPGPRDYTPEYYGAFLLDPDGHSVEAVSLEDDRRPGQIDHLWLRTTNMDAVSAFYETIAPAAGFEVERRGPEHTHIHSATGSFSFIAGDPPTRHVHIAFEAPTNAAVDAFHRTATDAGYTDNGAPGERLIYHPGYYGAFVLDPDGHNVEAVNHNR
jgi:catechol 2,3-dioxygenase-like lactoylglutathione lyase family enzyme